MIQNINATGYLSLYFAVEKEKLAQFLTKMARLLTAVNVSKLLSHTLFLYNYKLVHTIDIDAAVSTLWL